ncbi:TIGR03984 family CRISPR-associated protein [bacterium]|nr:TIGR03984 family CRISPR-associated protein [bacterium]
MATKRALQNCTEALDTLSVPYPLDLEAWLSDLAGEDVCWLLAHADDGVIWGRVTGAGVETVRNSASGNHDAVLIEALCPVLRLETLQTLRLFNSQAEMLLWRGSAPDQWQARIISSQLRANGERFAHCLDEHHLLWGNSATAVSTDFTLLRDSGQGLQHIVPLAIDSTELPLKLFVRHFVQADATGFAQIVASRLVNLGENDV